jgi:hypothetical protein
MLQETHLLNTNAVSTLCKVKFAESTYKSNSAGVLTLYNNEFETLFESHDEKGRQSYVVIKNSILKLLLVNIYVQMIIELPWTSLRRYILKYTMF